MRASQVAHFPPRTRIKIRPLSGQTDPRASAPRDTHFVLRRGRRRSPNFALAMAETELTLVYFDALCDALSLPLGPLLLLGGPSGAWFVPYMAAFAFGRVACVGMRSSALRVRPSDWGCE